MSTSQRDVHPSDQERQAGQRRADAILRQVLQKMGRPSPSQRIQVRPLWNYHFRVNVFVDAELGTAHLTHSYFVVADDAGTILSAVPAIVGGPD